MVVTIESDVECTLDGVGLLKPGKPVVVDVAYFKVFHKVTPAEANFPPSIHVTYVVDKPVKVTEELESNLEKAETEDSGEEA